MVMRCIHVIGSLSHVLIVCIFCHFSKVREVDCN
jgi:hypothetical protein